MSDPAAMPEEPGPATAPEARAANDSNPAEPSAEAAKLEAVLAENADVKDRLLRAAAEMENLRRRTEREVADAKTYAVTGFARDMLAVADNLRRAIEAAPKDQAGDPDGPLARLLEGVAVTERELLAILNRQGVRKLEPMGQKFDPNFHQAMFEVETTDAANGTVMQVVQPGYSIGERVLRPAMVGIAKVPKGAKPAPKAEDAEAAATGVNRTV